MDKDNSINLPSAPSGRWFSTEIYFGRHFSTRGEISEQQFDRFLAHHVTPAFPAGMTVYDAYGQMQHHSGQIAKQKTKVVVLVHQNSKADDDAINKIINAYRDEFGNPQVMLLTRAVKPVFWPD
jgi:hypothetical protein